MDKLKRIVLSGLVAGAAAGIGAILLNLSGLTDLTAQQQWMVTIATLVLKAVQKVIDSSYKGSLLLGS